MIERDPGSRYRKLTKFSMAIFSDDSKHKSVKILIICTFPMMIQFIFHFQLNDRQKQGNNNANLLTLRNVKLGLVFRLSLLKQTTSCKSKKFI